MLGLNKMLFGALRMNGVSCTGFAAVSSSFTGRYLIGAESRPSHARNAVNWPSLRLESYEGVLGR